MRRKTYNMSIYQKKYKAGAGKKEQEEVDITSLLDILVILLVFLLKSYNASSLELDLVKNLDLTVSTSQDLGQFGPTVQITNTEDVYLNNKLITNLSNPELGNLLGARLQEVKSAAKDQKANHINFVLDNTIKYEKVDRVMTIASQQEFENFKFIVRGNGS